MERTELKGVPMFNYVHRYGVGKMLRARSECSPYDGWFTTLLRALISACVCVYKSIFADDEVRSPFILTFNNVAGNFESGGGGHMNLRPQKHIGKAVNKPGVKLSQDKLNSPLPVLSCTPASPLLASHFAAIPLLSPRVDVFLIRAEIIFTTIQS